MKIVRIAVACLTVAACASGPVGHPLATPEQSLVIAKAEYGFEVTYNVAGNAYLAAVKAGALDPATKAKCKALLAQAYDAVKVARTAQRLADAQGVAAQAVVIVALTGEVTRLIQGASH